MLPQFISLSPSRDVSTSLFIISASPLLPCKWVHQFHLSRFHIYIYIYIYIHIYIYTVFVFLFLICFALCNSLYLGSQFIHLIRTDSDVLLIIAEQYSIEYMYHNVLVHSSANGHLGCFHVLAIVNIDKSTKTIQWRKIVFSINVAGTLD